jgi:hypothetical protein
MSYIVPTNELTLTDIKAYRSAAVEAGITRALALGLARSRDELIVRQALPFTDFPLGWFQEQYRNPVIAAAGWGCAFDFNLAGAGVLPGNAPVLANSKVAVFYKWANYTAAPIAIGVRFRVGGTGATTKGIFHTQLDTGSKLEPDLYFTEPVIYDPQDVVFIELYYTAAVAVGAELFAFGCFITERAGANVS